MNFEDIRSRAYADFEEQSNLLDPSIIIINYCFIINVYYIYNCIINS
jgi:hypothetical protein